LVRMDRKKERVCVGQTSQLAVGPSESGPCGERREREGKSLGWVGIERMRVRERENWAGPKRKREKRDGLG